jgi:hypothetical protein
MHNNHNAGQMFVLGCDAERHRVRQQRRPVGLKVKRAT